MNNHQQHSESNPLLEVRNLTFAYSLEEAPAFKEISFTVHSGDALLFLGPSGCGKSTLMYCLNRLYPDSIDGHLQGDIILDGKNINLWSSKDVCRRIGIVFQDPETQFCMTRVDEEVAFSLENIGLPRSQMDSFIDQALSSVGLLPYRNHLIHTLSGGQKQKLAIACALVLETDLLILDEPTAQLDPASTLEMVNLIRRLKQERKMTIIVVEHRLDAWMDCIDRCLLFNKDGQLWYEGEPQQCFTQYADLLSNQGIWIPAVTSLAMQLKHQRIWRHPFLPVTVDELIEHLNEQETLQYLKFLSDSHHDNVDADLNSLSLPSSCLETHSIVVEANDYPILKEISVSFSPGQLTAIIGKNGSGKTTLLEQLRGIGLKKKHGQVLLNHIELSLFSEEQISQWMGYVFQNPEHQFIEFTVYDELAFGFHLNGLEEEAIALKVNQLMEEYGLIGLEQASPYGISQGEKRRLSTAGMMMNSPQWLLLDEPTFGLDAATSKQFMHMLRQKLQEGTSIIMITHDMNLVEEYADRAIVIRNGKIQFDGVPVSLWNDKQLLVLNDLIPPVQFQVMEKLMQSKGCLV